MTAPSALAPAPSSGGSSGALAYAVIREDARIEGDLVNRFKAERLLCVASGGCVALSLASRFPELAVTAFDASQAQLDHLEKKAEAARNRDLKALNVEDASAQGLNQCGEIENVFRLLRKYFEDHIAPHEEMLTFFVRGRPIAELDALVRKWVTSKNWPTAFTTCFTDGVIASTLGREPLRWPEPGARPRYFQKAFERGFRRDAAPENPFLQHVFLGGYRRGCEPHYIRNGGKLDLERVLGTLVDVPDLARFDVLSLSNMFDAMDDEATARHVALLKEKVKPGGRILIRQLSSARNVRPLFEPEFTFDSALGRSYMLRDRSMFYIRFEVGTRAG